MQENKGKPVLFVCEKFYLRFYQPLAARLFESGFTPIWIVIDDVDRWDYDCVVPGAAIERLIEAPDLSCRNGIEELCVLERAVFDRPTSFRSYPYTLSVVRTPERAPRLAEVWYRSTLALLRRFQPPAVFIWNGRYLPYRAISAACESVGQLLLTSEIGWIPGTMFVDRGPLSGTVTDLFGRGLEAPQADLSRADRFLTDYTAHKATMVSQTMAQPAEVRARLLGETGKFLLMYGCQVDWDTNVLIGARRFRSNTAAVAFLLECMAAVPGARLVVKTHPLDSEKDEGTLGEIIGDRGTVTSDIHPHALIEAADAVAVRNSTLGFEALCYAKPLIVLEHAKYIRPDLTLDARTVAEGAANLVRVSNGTCNLPDPVALRRFILHLVDHYLFPVRYRYHFEPANLDILSHFVHNDSYRGLLHVLDAAQPISSMDVDDRVWCAMNECKLYRPRPPSFLERQVRRVSNWLSAGSGHRATSK